MAMWRGNQSLRQATQAIIDAGRARPSERTKAIEEALADRPVAEIAKLKGFLRFVAAIRDWLRMTAKRLRAGGFETLADAIEPKTWTDADVAAFVLRAEQVSGSGGTGGAFSRAKPRVTVDRDADTGAPVYATDDITIGFPQETERFEYIGAEGEKIVNYSIGPADGFDSYGMVELIIGADGVPTALADIEIKPEYRGQDLGAKAVGAILAAHPGLDLNISNIVEGARGFWDRMGIPEQNRASGEAYDGTLNWQTFSQAQNQRRAAGAGARGRAAGEGRNAQAEGGALGAAVQAQGEVRFSRAMRPRSGTEDEARAAGYTLKAYRGVSKAAPFNDSGTTWMTTSREVAEAYAEEVMGYDDPDVLTVMVKPDDLPRHDASRLTDEQREALAADGFGNPQAPGIYDRSDDHPLGGSRRNVTVIHAPNDAVWVVQGEGQAMFSRATGLDPWKVSAQDLVNSTGGVFDFNRLGETQQDRIRTTIDGSRPFWLGALTRDQLADVYGAEIPQVKEYDTLTRAMENERSRRAQDADALYQEWAKIRPAANLTLARTMADATLYSVDPDADFKPIEGNDAATEAERQQVHARISRDFEALPPDAKAIYAKVKEFHLNTLRDLQQSLIDRIERQVEAGAARQAALTDIRQRFDKYLENGPYFPLSRFGDFLVVATRESDGERVVAAYETAGEQQAAARRLEDDGFRVKMKTAKTYSRAEDGSAGKFIGDVLNSINSLDMDDAKLAGSAQNLKDSLLDDINQLFIRALPDLSYRKHFAHRKGTPGFSSDMMRGFASSAFHSASHLARLNHGDKMTFALRDAYTAIENAPEGDFNKHTQVLNELTKRHDAALNPNTHPIASFLNSLGFTMYLGLSPAAGLINMLQVPMVALPHIGARYGFGRASAAMGKAYKDIMGAPMNKSNGFNAAESLKLTPQERAAISALQSEGVIDLTQAHDLASATGLDTGNVARSKAAFAMARAMKIVGWTFHVPEVMNRQVTALTAYRLEMAKSGNEDAAMDAAREAIKRTQFDYSASNRARYMQGNLARVVTQFKQYSQNMTYLLARAMQQALKGETPEVRAIARRQLVATLGITFAMAGSLGLPGLSMLGGLIGMAANGLGDDDEPWEWKVEFRNLMADTFGKEVGEVISHGVPRALMPWDLASRVGLGDMWFRDGGRVGDNPREAFAADIAAILGPTAGTLLGWYTASDHMARGQYGKAAEAVVPKFIRDPLKALREGSDGVTSYSGEPLMDLTSPEAIGRLLGFAPARASEMYEARNAVMNAKTTIDDKRKALLGQAVKARMDGDNARYNEVQNTIIEWNRRNPEARITPLQIRQSVMNKQRNRQNTENGITLPRTRENLRDIGRFASVE